MVNLVYRCRLGAALKGERQMDESWAAQHMLERVLQETSPRHYLIIGDAHPLDPEPTIADTPQTTITRLRPEQTLDALPRHGRQDLVLVGALEAFPRADGEILLSRLRDLYARRVLARLRPSPEWEHRDMTAFGFTRLARLGANHGLLYGFDMATYKTTPDWLNPRFWANPELWGKYRW